MRTISHSIFILNDFIINFLYLTIDSDLMPFTTGLNYPTYLEKSDVSKHILIIIHHQIFSKHNKIFF
jgi:hypothetical protein